MGLILVLCYGLLGAFFLRYTKGGFANPVVIFFSLWSLIFLIYEFRGSLAPNFELAEYGLAIGSFYLIIGIVVASGALLSHLFQYFLPKKENAYDVYVPANRLSASYNPQFAVFLSYVSVILAGIALLQAPYSISDYLTIGGQIRSAYTLSYDPLSSLASMLSSYSAYLAIVPALISLYSGNRRQLWPYLPFAACLIVSLISIAKYTVIQFAVMVLAVYLCLNKINFANIFPFVKKVLVALVVMVLIFLSTDVLRGNDHRQVESPASRIASVMFMYGVGHINTFSIFFSNVNDAGASSTKNAGFSNVSMTDETEFGERTFSSIYRLMYWIGVKDNIPYTRYEGVKGFNTASIYRPLLEDFGVNGVYVAMFFMGFILQLASRLSMKRSPGNITLLSFIILFTVFMPIHSLFNFIYFPMCLLCGPLVARVFTIKGNAIEY